MSSEHVICIILFQSVLQQANSLISPDKNGFGSDQEIESEKKYLDRPISFPKQRSLLRVVLNFQLKILTRKN